MRIELTCDDWKLGDKFAFLKVTQQSFQGTDEWETPTLRAIAYDELKESPLKAFHANQFHITV